MTSDDVVVIGAGVIGLTSAIALAEAGRRVRVLAADPPERTTSAVAGALVAQIGPPGPMEPRAAGWVAATTAELMPLAGRAGVHVTDGLLIAPFAGLPPPGAERLPGFRLCQPNELPAGYQLGFRASLPLVDMRPYLAHLLDRLGAAGGTLEASRIADLAQAFTLAPVVVNCTGLGARELVGDGSVIGVRGQHVVVRNPGLTEFVLEAPISPTWAAFFPHAERVVLGGLADADDDRPEPDPAIAAAIVDRCAAIEPRLRHAEVVEHQVGFRPTRQTVRLELEHLDGCRVVHNYGHGGMGVSFSWGCARDVLALLSGRDQRSSSATS
jgi:D-amino-acid oxidase